MEHFQLYMYVYMFLCPCMSMGMLVCLCVCLHMFISVNDALNLWFFLCFDHSRSSNIVWICLIVHVVIIYRVLLTLLNMTIHVLWQWTKVLKSIILFNHNYATVIQESNLFCSNYTKKKMLHRLSPVKWVKRTCTPSFLSKNLLWSF